MSCELILLFTGESYIPDVEGEIRIKHPHRHASARRLGLPAISRVTIQLLQAEICLEGGFKPWFS